MMKVHTFHNSSATLPASGGCHCPVAYSCSARAARWLQEKVAGQGDSHLARCSETWWQWLNVEGPCIAQQPAILPASASCHCPVSYSCSARAAHRLQEKVAGQRDSHLARCSETWWQSSCDACSYNANPAGIPPASAGCHCPVPYSCSARAARWLQDKVAGQGDSHLARCSETWWQWLNVEGPCISQQPAILPASASCHCPVPYSCTARAARWLQEKVAGQGDSHLARCSETWWQ